MNDTEIHSLIGEAVAFAEPRLKGASLKPEDTIAELGINSIAVLEIVGYLEDKLGVRFPDDELAQLNTIGGLSDLIRGHDVAAQPAQKS
ncbi:MAG: acyl carrier protein [Acidobacteria bacterium]|nr:acyl carrier protein [Acidobacteriota bacterium]MCA1609981.1 acyl carrier protein [Acidobacteriota bacterium]